MKLTAEEERVLEATMNALRAAGARRPFFEVRPRYTGGSPALVSVGICVHEAVSERDSYQRYLSGVYGEENKAKAEKLRLEGICFARWQKGKKVFRYDLICEQTYQEPPRLTTDEKQRVQVLRNWKKYGICRWGADKEAELAALENRLAMHREVVE